LTTAVLALAEMFPLPVGTKSPTPGKGTRKRYTALIYSLGLSVLAWIPGLLTVPPEGNVPLQAISVVVLAIIAVGTSHYVVKGKHAWDARKKQT